MTVTFSQAEKSGVRASEALSHGMGKTLEEAVWPEISDNEVERVLQTFPQIGKLEAILWRSPRPFSAAARVRTRKGIFFVKRHHAQLRSPTDLREEHRLNSYLRSKGGAVVPVLASREEETVFRMDAGTTKYTGWERGLTFIRIDSPGHRFCMLATLVPRAGRWHKCIICYSIMMLQPDQRDF